MDDLISRKQAVDAINNITPTKEGFYEPCEVFEELMRLPSAQPKTGKWLEKEVLHKAEAETVIEEWQSCKCSVCGRYDTRPYLYYFDEPHFCSWCGADMKEDGKQDE